jgi:hypothetical protein
MAGHHFRNGAVSVRRNGSGADQGLASSTDGMTGPVRAQRSRLAKGPRDISDDILAVHSRIRLAVLQHEHTVAARLQGTAVKANMPRALESD